ncbi:MAG TPA: hypothetical protein PKA27_12665 [Fimbriimonadaceae bacterium]|nr:hypothetical protein [Fimbriimonadaceae bacterium]
MKSFRSMLTLCALVATQMATAQGGTDIVRPYKRVQLPAPTVVSTHDFFPQVNPGYSLRGIRAPHDPGFEPPRLDRNSLVAGQNTELQNVLNGSKWPAISATGWTPPDPDLGVGNSHVVVVVNSSIAFFTKAGVKTFEQTFENFFSSVPGVTNFLFDPKAMYDPIAQRFYVVCLEQSDADKISKGIVCVSDNADPNGNWFIYRVETKQVVGANEFWLDYPGWGFNKDAIVMTGNMFGFTGGYNGIQYIVMPKAGMLAGTAPVASYLTTPGGTAHPARTIDANLDKIYFATVASTNAIQVGVLTNLTGTPTLQTRNVTVPSFEFPNASESTNGRQLDAIGGRLMNAFWRGGSLIAAHTVRPAGGQPNAARWYEIATNNFPAANPTLVQSGNVVGPSGVHYSMPAATSNSAGDIAVVFARSSASICMDFMGAGRKRTDPLGTMGAAKLLSTSPGNTYGGPGGNRFGDYFGICVDPVDNTTFWGVGMVAQTNGNWLTVVNSFQISTPGGGGGLPTFNPTSIVKVQGGASFGTVADATNSDNRYFGVPSIPVARTGQVASAAATYTVNKSGTQFGTMGLKLESSAATGVTVSIFGWDWANGSYKYLGAIPSGAADASKTFVIPASSIRTFVSTSRQVKILVRGISPQRTTSTPVPFNFRIDQIQLYGQ